MSRTTKLGKRGKYTRTLKTPPKDVGDVARHRATHGATERILRRNRKTWTRLGNKRRRQLDTDATKGDAIAARTSERMNTSRSPEGSQTGLAPSTGEPRKRGVVGTEGSDR